jgi:hypothetical protein
MGVWAWVILFAWSAALATAAQHTLFRRHRNPTDHDWVFIACGALLGGFTAHVWYPGFGPVVDGLNLVQALVGGAVGWRRHGGGLPAVHQAASARVDRS